MLAAIPVVAILPLPRETPAMNPRARAASILQQARDILAERLTERVLESAQEILDDAQGHSYLSEIEAVYDQVGARLAHINTLLANLPPVEEPPSDAASTDPIYTDVGGFSGGNEQAGTFSLATLALPGPTVAEERLQIAAPPATLQSFAVEIEALDLDAAGRTLAQLFEVDPARGRHCAETFAAKLAESDAILSDVLTLREDVTRGNVNRSLLLLWECFGLQPVESISVFQALKTRFTGEQRP
jgi:hypothetical protein